MALNWPNRITILRILLSPLFMVLLMNTDRTSRIAALAVFIIAALSDIYDGYIARKYGWVTNLGKFLDPLADKLFVALALIGLVQIELMPVWGAFLIIGRELLVTGLRAIAAYAGVLILPSRMGKWKTVAQMFSLLCYLLLSVESSSCSCQRCRGNGSRFRFLSGCTGNCRQHRFLYRILAGQESFPGLGGTCFPHAHSSTVNVGLQRGIQIVGG